MNSFSALRFSAYAKDLEQAILGMSEDMPPRGWPVRYRTPEQPKPMSEPATNVTPLPVVEIEQPKPETAVTVAAANRAGITGAGSLGASIADLIDAISAEVDDAFQGIQDSAKELRAGINSAKDVSKALKSEADVIKQKLGKFNNFTGG